MSISSVGKKGGRKIGRNLAKCKRYRDENRREKNKRRRMEKLKRKYAKNKKRRELREQHAS